MEALFSFVLILSVARPTQATYRRDVTGPSTARSLYEVLDELDGLYASCDEMLSDLKNEVVVDVGAGPGRFVAELKARDPNLSVFGLDLRKPRLTTDFVVANARALPFGDGTVTRMLAVATLYLWSRDDHDLIRDALKESYRVLKPGGWLAIVGGDYRWIARTLEAERIGFAVTPRPLNLMSHLKLTKIR